MKKSPLIGISLRNGLIAGALAGIFLVAMYYMGPHPMLIDIPFVDFRTLLFGIFIFFTLKEFRDSHQQGELYFVQGMLASAVFTIVAATVGASCVLLFSKLEPDFISDFINKGLEAATAKRLLLTEASEKARFDVMIEGLPATNGKALAMQHFVQSLFIAFFISIILSVFLRKQAKP